MQVVPSINRHPKQTLLLKGSWAEDTDVHCTDTQNVVENTSRGRIQGRQRGRTEGAAGIPLPRGKRYIGITWRPLLKL